MLEDSRMKVRNEAAAFIASLAKNSVYDAECLAYLITRKVRAAGTQSW
jgi:hypothetical protein